MKLVVSYERARLEERSMAVTLQELASEGDRLMQAGEPAQAYEKYKQAWNTIVDQPDLLDAYGEEPAVWLLLSAVDAKFSLDLHEEAYEVCYVIFERFAESAVGNPFFHLRAGQCMFEEASPEERANPESESGVLDNLARALIGGGVSLFDEEDPKYLELIVSVLEPPDGFEDWEATRGHDGNSQDKLNGAGTYLQALFERRFGRPPPYERSTNTDLEILRSASPDKIRDSLELVLAILVVEEGCDPFDVEALMPEVQRVWDRICEVHGAPETFEVKDAAEALTGPTLDADRARVLARAIFEVFLFWE